MPSIIYNDDVEMYDPSYYYGSNVSDQITDESTPSTNPQINPIPVTDNTTRTDDGWTADTTATAGTSGETYNDTPPTELQPKTYTTKTIKQKTRIVINDYSSAYLLNLYNQGYKFYVVYTDGTSEEIAYTDIVQPAVQQSAAVVNEAYAIAVATDQHFWDDTNGAHVTDVTKDDWATAVSASFSDLSDQKPYHNILINSLGILLRRALYNLVSISKSSIAFYDGLGNNANNILASYGRTGVQIGATDRKHLVMNENGVAVYNADGSLAAFNAENIQTDHLAIGTIQTSISDISTIRSNANKVSDLSKSTLESLIAESSTIYISKATGTSSVAASTTKVTETRDLQNTWSLKRPTYDPDYPVVFVALQTVEADGSYFCSTPLKDDTLTVIDGGHITTGTIDAARIAVNQITVGSLQDGADYATKAAAMDSMQYVYKSAAANTTSVTGPTAWVTTTSDSQDTWTTTRPTYNASYPKLFVCKQTKKINNTVTSTTPVLDKATSDAISTAASDATSKANTAQTNAEATAANLYATKTAAVTGVQYIYISKASGTTSVTAPTTWITENRDLQNTWTTKRPTYDSQYPVTYIAKQTKTADDTVVTTTPMKDDTTTIIDGGHITTGTIDASAVNVTNIDANNITTGTIDASTVTVTNINADNITSGTISADKISGGTLQGVQIIQQTSTRRIVLDTDGTIDFYRKTANATAWTYTGTIQADALSSGSFINIGSSGSIHLTASTDDGYIYETAKGIYPNNGGGHGGTKGYCGQIKIPCQYYDGTSDHYSTLTIEIMHGRIISVSGGYNVTKTAW